MYSLELQTWRNFSVPVKLFQKASSFSGSFSSVSAVAGVIPQNVRKGKSFTVSYPVDSLGVAKKLTESTSRKLRSEGKGNPDSVQNLLKSCGFTDSQIASIIKSYTPLLRADAEKSLGPKLKFLQSRGASSSEVKEIVSKFPKILGMRSDKARSLYYDFVKEIIEADKSSNYVKLCRSSLQAEGSPHEIKFRNVLVLRDLGVPQKFLFSLLISNRRSICGKEKFEESLKKVVEMGFDPKTPKFVNALRVLLGTNDKAIEERVNAYRSLGFSVDDVWAMFKKHPCCLAISEKKILNSIETFIGLGLSKDELMVMVKRFPPCLNSSAKSLKKKTEFLVKKMNWSLKALASNPSAFGYSIEERIVPRCNVIKALISKGLIEIEPPALSYVLATADEAFLNRYVKMHDNEELVAELMAIFTRDFAS